MNAAKVSVILPTYNESSAINGVVSKLKKMYPQFEVIVINDGSKDDTAIEAEKAGAKVYSHPYNIGNGAAVKSGIRMATGDVLVFMDGDGQHDPNELPHFFETAERSGVDIIVGCRMRNTRNMPWLRLMANRATSRVVSALSRQLVTDSQSGYRWMRE